MINATLLVIRGADQGTRFEIGESVVSLGRGVRNDIRVLDTEVSRLHATIGLREDEFFLQDLDSSNGTFVNGQNVTSCQLSSGDQIQMGRSVFLFSITSPDESQFVADKVDLVGHQQVGDHSQIVAEAQHGANETLLRKTTDDSTTALHQTLANLQALYRISEVAATGTVSLEQLLPRILNQSIEVVDADRGCILLADENSGQIMPQYFSHRDGRDVSGRMPISRSIVDYVLKNGQGVRTSDAKSDQRFDTGQSILQAGIREAICVPMQGRYELVGVIYVDTNTPQDQTVVLEGSHVNKFSDEQLRLLLAIARQSALAIENDHYQQAFVKAERLAAVGQTIATLSHHIKNILQGVRGGSYLIDMGLKDHDESLVHKGWNIVEKNQNKIYHLVMDMLTYSTERKPALEPAEVDEIVEDVVELMQARAEENGVDLIRKSGETVPESTFDKEGIHRAVLNIITNAIDALENIEEGRIEIETGYNRETDEIFIAISDNGPGIPEDQIEKVFNLFESTKGARGTGLGLAVSRKIIREHGGDIVAESELNRGTRFTLVWPKLDEDPIHGDRETIA